MIDLPMPEPMDKFIRASRARALLDDPVFSGAVAGHRETLIRRWAMSKPDDHATREAAYAEMRALDEVVRALEGFETDGKVEMIRRQKLTAA